jgi:hypothetical protein
MRKDLELDYNMHAFIIINWSDRTEMTVTENEAREGVMKNTYNISTRARERLRGRV